MARLCTFVVPASVPTVIVMMATTMTVSRAADAGVSFTFQGKSAVGSDGWPTTHGASQLSAMAAALVTDAFPSELLILSLKEISWARGLRMPVTHRFQAFPCRMAASPRKLSAFVSKEQSFVLPYNRSYRT